MQLLNFSLAIILSLLFLGVEASQDGFIFNGFQSAKQNLSLDGIAEFTDNGLLKLTNNTYNSGSSHAFYQNPIPFKTPSSSNFSFSTTFVFAIRSENPYRSSQGLAFVISPTEFLPGGRSWRFLGLFNESTNGSADNHIFAVEFDTSMNPDSTDINDNHVGVDIYSIDSVNQTPAGYYDNHDPEKFHNVTLMSGDPIQAWVDYDGGNKQISVTLAPLKSFSGRKPNFPLLSFNYDLSPVLLDSMYVGFASSTSAYVVNHYVLGWSFMLNGLAQNLDISQLPKLPKKGGKKKLNYFLITGLPLICLFSIIAGVLGTIYYVNRKKKFAELLEDWEVAYGPHRFKYRDLYKATKGFKDSELLGAGGFGRVYKGVLPTTKLQIAVKRVSHESKQGMREFVAEIVSIGRMSHRNLVPLLGYCRRSGELLLVYEYMPHGSLDQFLHGPRKSHLNWYQRFRIIKGVASALFYLHEEWEQVVVHRDVKASNVLLDAELNGRLGDFGLARLYDHGSDPQTTHVVGTVGYLAPEHYLTGRATTNTDVYAFGAFLLEVVCGRRPIEQKARKQDMVLVDRVLWLWSQGRIMEAVDPSLGTNNIVKNEAELVLKLGLLCCNSEPEARPTMQKVVLYLDGAMALPELSSSSLLGGGIATKSMAFDSVTSFEDVSVSSYSFLTSSTQYSHASGSILSGGR
ncbi:OLC1v1002971C1 [Oldenlandia corymbosa var. corymbosa]|uniref:non-specific serine/threonine protein kinase n=1 Tax=Oldenlandia corymbosa var. corymbosa TaxID=529605 RepID=A0AAV1DBU9_OLDCO|nr:OLC1v1002971C1 [Oldenlandia corymbosa var. corymbosa]